MENVNKLHLPGYSKAIFIISVQVILALTAILLGGENAVYIILFIMIVISSTFSLMTKNLGYILLTICLLVFALARAGLTDDNQTIKILSVTGHVVALGIVFYIIFSRISKWRFRELFEMAAMPVNELKNGFTARPFPAGQIDYSRDELKRFAKYLLKHLIAVPYYEKDRVVLVLSGSMYLRAMGLKHDYKNDTWIAFSDSGNVSVNIHEKTYLWYKDQLSFDQLCASLGGLFIEFFTLFKKGQGRIIILRMNVLKENVLAEV